jgi:hypothetical protein
MKIDTDTMISQCITIKLTPHEAHQLWLAVTAENPVAIRVNDELAAYVKRMKVKS